ncbi:7-carboxy-7-deazaguanine synthase [Candidatus Methanobinarius endosymbioticus]|uniref:7-carboxy-7-deazaguanine synthase n=1 Tax=Candidatus Methanobinarius endosymbioticus TaxID=2006182 RepID=A0A366MCL8_9EURY|nr:7-carboxy-7-deazaguanine synthase [Candidatus Methanobinarius endosymbioticus]
MEIGGTIISSVEYNGKMSLVIFMAKCPLRCPYCHNSELLDNGEKTTLEEIYKTIDDSSDFIDAVVVSGGEPLVHSEELINILMHSKSLNLKTKVDTSGYYPKRLNEVLKYTDYIAIDIKVPFDKYKDIIGADVGNNVKKSMKMTSSNTNTFLECRTTYVPTLLNHDDIKQISHEIDCDLYTLQQFRSKSVLDDRLEDVESPNPNELKSLAREIKPFLNKVKIKTSEFGEEYI